MGNKKVRVLVVGQTPPPYHGQAVMIEKLVNAGFESIEIVHLRMAFSKSIQEVGKFSWRKPFHLIHLLLRGLFILAFRSIDVLYYFPAGPDHVAMLRDIFLLPWWRLFGKRLVYHFQAGGLGEFIKSRPAWLKRIVRWAYGVPDVAIILSSFNAMDGEYFDSKKVCVIPNGLEDAFRGNRSSNSSETSILHLGILSEEKGVFVLLEAFHKISTTSPNVMLQLAGEFRSKREEQEFLDFVESRGLKDRVKFHGLVTGEKKWQLLEQCDIFCFLSHYRAETFGNVVVEAMMFELPVVAARWRGVQDIVLDGSTGFLVPPKDVSSTVERLNILMSDPEMRKRFGQNARKRYLEEFTLARHLSLVEQAILESIKAL